MGVHQEKKIRKRSKCTRTLLKRWDKISTKERTYLSRAVPYKCGEKGHLTWECTKKKIRKRSKCTRTLLKRKDKISTKERTYLSRAVPEEESIKAMCSSTTKALSIRLRIPVFWLAKNPITVHCNNGSSYTNIEGDLGGMTVNYNPYGIVNVPSLESTKAKHRVIYDSCDHDGVFKVHTVGGVRFCRLVLILTLVSIGLQCRIGVAGKIPSYLLSSIYSSFAKLWCENYGETQGRGDIHSLYLQ
jgi:hypothetical protein